MILRTALLFFLFYQFWLFLRGWVIRLFEFLLSAFAPPLRGGVSSLPLLFILLSMCLRIKPLILKLGEGIIIYKFKKMENLIVQKLDNIEKMLQKQNLQNKQVLNLEDACKYLDISRSHLYKLTSTKKIPHYCPQGKRLYFKKSELEDWLLRNRSSTSNEIDETAINYVIGNPRR